MNLFEDRVYDVVIDSIEPSASGGIAWNGRIDGISLSYAHMAYTDGVLAAHIASPEGAYEVQYAAKDVYRIIQIDQSQSEGDDVVRVELPRMHGPPSSRT